MPHKKRSERDAMLPDFVRHMTKKRKTDGMTLAAATEIIGGVFEDLAELLTSGDYDSVAIPGFGRFYINTVAPREYKVPTTGETGVSPAAKAIRFKPSDILKYRLKGRPRYQED